ncbi:MAG TPA: hypothetical protein VMB77_12580 [Syntrophales bacterium]|nr:hypothetical protein [Syntrophales bacterium]
MKTTRERRILKRDSHLQIKRNQKQGKTMQETHRGTGEFQRERLGFVLESGV